MTDCPYGACDGSGFVVDEATNTATDCRCRALRVAEARTRALEARIPKRFQGVSLDRAPIVDAPAPVVAELRRYVDRLDEHLDAGRGIWFVGDPGTGKTAMAMLVSRTAIEARRTVAIYSLPRLLSMLRESIASEDGLLDLIDRVAGVDLLHIDDLGAEHRTEWVLEQLYTIVNARYEDGRALVLTTNLLPDELEGQIGARTVSRIVEMCGDPLPMFGTDRRKEHRAA